MRRTATRALLVALVALILSTLLLAGAPPTAQAATGYAAKLLSLYGSDVIAYWPLNETAGSVAEDIGPNGYDATIYGVTLDSLDGAGSTLGRAGLWDGINDYIQYNATMGDMPSSGALMMWLKPDASFWDNVTGHAIFFLEGSSAGNLLQPAHFIYYGNGHIETAWKGNGTQTQHSYATDSPTVWGHYLWLWDAGKLHLYINGEEKGFETAITAWSAAIARIKIGTGWPSYYPGAIQHVVFVGRAPTPEEIAESADPTAAQPTPTPTPLPLSHYMTLESGQPVRLDYSATAGDMLIGTLLLVVLGLGAFLLFLTMRGRA